MADAMIRDVEDTMIIHPYSVPEEVQPGRSLILKRVIRAEDHGPNLSVTWVRISGHHERVVNDRCDRVYYIIEGSGRFQVGDGAPVETVSAGGFVYIAHGTPYEFSGEMTYLVSNGPAFTQGSDRVLTSILS